VSLGVICTICYSYGGLSETAIKPLYRIYFMQVRSSTGLLIEQFYSLLLGPYGIYACSVGLTRSFGAKKVYFHKCISHLQPLLVSYA